MKSYIIYQFATWPALLCMHRKGYAVTRSHADNDFYIHLFIFSPASSVRNLGIYLESDSSMTIHVSKTVSSCFAALRQIRSVTRPVLLSLVQSLVLTRLDTSMVWVNGWRRDFSLFCTPLLGWSTPSTSTNATAHGTALVVCTWAHSVQTCDARCLHGTAPPYFADQLQSVAALESRRRLRSSA